MILFSNGTSDCVTLENKLKEKGADYEVHKDIVLMKDLGFLAYPVLEADGQFMKFAEAMSYLEKN